MLVFLLNHDGRVIHCENTQKEQCNADDANRGGTKLEKVDFPRAASAFKDEGYGVCQHCLP